jgi:hypothetical protein
MDMDAKAKNIVDILFFNSIMELWRNSYFSVLGNPSPFA